MRIIAYSDLHLEFGSGWTLPPESKADVLILAGDIVSFQSYAPLESLLKRWNRPALYVTGNHEYYTRTPMTEEEGRFRDWLASKFPNVTLLLDDEVSIDGAHFFGGTMWTDFNGGDLRSMEIASSGMNDFQLIENADGTPFRPADSVALHKEFVRKLLSWFQRDLNGPRVVIAHHAPVVNPNTKYGASPLMPAFNSLDILALIEAYQPALWVYGHTHECDEQTFGRTRIISNQLGYPNPTGGFECENFDRYGRPQTLTG